MIMNRLSEFFKRQIYLEYFLWIFHTAQVTCKMQVVDNKLNRYVNNAFRSVICHMNTVGVKLVRPE